MCGGRNCAPITGLSLPLYFSTSCFSSIPEAPLRRRLRRQAVIAALGPVCWAVSNFDNGIAPGAAHGCAPISAAHIPCRAVSDLPHRQRLSDRGDGRGEEDENAAERRRDSAHGTASNTSSQIGSVPPFAQGDGRGGWPLGGRIRMDMPGRIPERRPVVKSPRLQALRSARGEAA